jgi:predicted phosphate transport protein (TIGR00153 family)
MRLKEFFGFLLPEDRKFFPLFSGAADNLVVASGLLVQLVREKDLSRRPEYIQKIREAEHTGDRFTRSLLNELNGTLITPLDREDIHELINTMDDIVDYIYSASTKISFYRMQELPGDFSRIAERIHSAATEIQYVLSRVRTAADFKNHVESNDKIREFERQVDDIYQEFLTRLFEQEVNPIVLIKKRDILSSLEKAIDKCDDVGNIFATIIIKMG